MPSHDSAQLEKLYDAWRQPAKAAELRLYKTAQ